MSRSTNTEPCFSESEATLLQACFPRATARALTPPTTNTFVVLQSVSKLLAYTGAVRLRSDSPRQRKYGTPNKELVLCANIYLQRNETEPQTGELHVTSRILLDKKEQFSL